MERIYHDVPQGESTYMEMEKARRETQGYNARNSDAQIKEEIKNRHIAHQGER